MERDFETVLAQQCAPTLAGIKPANLFSWKDAKKANLAYWRKILSPYGLRFRILKACPADGTCLVYLFRETWLCEILSNPDNRAFLFQTGYPDADWNILLKHLSGRLCYCRQFPHEIGIFLGYPLEDVTGFIQNHGRNYTCLGCWKAYGDPEEAARRFEAYHRCTAFYLKKLNMGVPLARLIAA